MKLLLTNTKELRDCGDGYDIIASHTNHKKAYSISFIIQEDIKDDAMGLINSIYNETIGNGNIIITDGMVHVWSYAYNNIQSKTTAELNKYKFLMKLMSYMENTTVKEE